MAMILTQTRGVAAGDVAGAMRGVAPTGLRVSEGRCTQGFRSQARSTPAYSLNAPNGASICEIALKTFPASAGFLTTE